jgi:Zn-dependent membrane protease YugP
MSCKDTQKFKTSEASTKSAMRTQGAIDKFLNITNLNLFRQLNGRWSRDAQDRFDIKGMLFSEKDNGKVAVPNKESFKKIDTAKGIVYQLDGTPSTTASSEMITKIKQVAEKMLQENGIFNVQVKIGTGFLSDNYNPKDKTVNLSPEVYNGSTISSTAVAAHECGHALQHATGYGMLNYRNNLVPLMRICNGINRYSVFAFFAFMILGGDASVLIFLMVIVYAASSIFSLITLPVEYDASARALHWLESTKLTNQNEHDKAADALKWAARTYVVAAMSSIAALLYYFSMADRKR